MKLRWHRHGRSAEEIAGLPVVTATEMRAAEQALFARGTPSFDVMSTAGRAVVVAIQQRWPTPFKRALVLAGPGNNGGDGFIVARELANLGCDVHVAAAQSRDLYSGDAARAVALWGGHIARLEPGALAKLDEGDCVVVDAIFGIGLARPVEGQVKAVIHALHGSPCPIVAVDVPSGIDADTGEVLGAAPRAALTVTFGWPKRGHLLLPGKEWARDLVVADIGCHDADLPGLGAIPRVNGTALWRNDLPLPSAADHKYTRGHALVAGGATMPGATRLASRAARRIGAGMLTVAAPREAHPFYLIDQPGLIVREAAGAAGLKTLLEDRRFTATLVGSGLPADSDTRAMVEAAAASGRALVIDGGGLTAFADAGDVLAGFGRADIILTPHEGEFARLFPSLKGDKLVRTREAARIAGCTVVVKGADTVIAGPDGRTAINADAPAWLATAGSGDVLAGLILGLLGQGMPAFEAAAAGVSLHGMAGAAFGPGLIAEDLPELIPEVLRLLSEVDPE
ncbi:NAD(P)H-hydrate dehydratase [Dongia sedimenti]|uniref:Bifunctional NAD(P)H-hydrate repair enzyme n=1 Tax=Dongia sedimenti TaxID=3064282 RepID=A0ABU0YT39_9PROT|nr:NAD(P)H-hydrate dehydratase [Rhodospirillaceae bacterium R-7]